jgi:hypothetical protein
MRTIVIVFIFAFISTSYGQKDLELKRKYFGKYKGTIPSYTIDNGTNVLTVGESAIYIDLFKDYVTIKVGNNAMTGTYTVMFEAKDYFLVDARIEGQMATERLLVYKSGKRLGRDGMYPQPVCDLVRYSRR